MLCCRNNGILPHNVDLNEMNIIESGLLELPDGVLTELHVTRAEQHGASNAAEITRDFQAYAFIPSGHERDPLFIWHKLEILLFEY
jgi:hypothetical protein